MVRLAGINDTSRQQCILDGATKQDHMAQFIAGLDDYLPVNRTLTVYSVTGSKSRYGIC
jgi:hypothetical protein